MIFSYSKGINNKLKFLAIYNIAGGLIGFGMILWLVSSLASFETLVLAFLSIVILLYGYSIISGILVLRKHPGALKHSLINQCLQLVGFSFIGVVFRYTSGVYTQVIVDMTESLTFGFDAGVSSFNLAFNTEPARIMLGINFVAVFLVYFILDLKKSIAKEERDGESSEGELRLEEVSEVSNKGSFKRLLDYVPLIILVISALNLLSKNFNGGIGLQTEHIIGLVLLLLPVCVIFIYHKLGVICLGALMVLGLFGIISYSPAISTMSLSKKISDTVDITFFYCQPIFLLWISIHLIISWRYYRCILTKRYWQNIYSDEPMKIE